MKALEVPARHSERRRWGVYYTPEWIARGLVGVLGALDPDRRARRMIDPTCGEGAFVAAARGAVGAPKARRYGIDRDPDVSDAWRSSDLGAEARLAVADALTTAPPPDWPRNFDWVMGNPPFGRWRPAPGELESLRDWARASDLEAVAMPTGDAVAFEWAFLARFAHLAAPGGWIAVIVPEGALTNHRDAPRRAALFGRTRLVAALTLPAGAFRARGTSARTAALIFQRSAPPADHRAWVGSVQTDEDWTAVARALAHGGSVLDGTWVDQADLAAGARLDAEYHRSEFTEIEDWLGAHGARPLGEQLCRAPGVLAITYGAIRTGASIGAAASSGGPAIPLIRGGEMTATGLDLRRALRVAREGPWDPPRSRALPGDLLLARSGAGSLGRGRMAIVTGAQALAVGCFVDRIRFARPENAVAAYWFLKSPLGWSQIWRRANGVGSPNLSFDEIRSLRIPPWTDATRRRLVTRHRQLAALHARGLTDDRARAKAEAALRSGIEALLGALVESPAERAWLLERCARLGTLGALGTPGAGVNRRVGPPPRGPSAPAPRRRRAGSSR
ncbi:MAG: N-6 DNA methylase [Myxococcales bacterium]|nr:N-6 DNA methylase [Myxococcales bacterium]